MAIPSGDLVQHYQEINRALTEISKEQNVNENKDSIERRCGEIAENHLRVNYDQTAVIKMDLAKTLKLEGKIDKKLYRKIKNIYKLRMEALNNQVGNSPKEKADKSADALSLSPSLIFLEPAKNSEKKAAEFSYHINSDTVVATIERACLSRSLIQSPFSRKEENAIIDTLRTDRDRRLIALLKQIDHPKIDDTLTRKCFPIVHAIYMGDLKLEELKPLQQQMHEICQKLGITLITDCPLESLRAQPINNDPAEPLVPGLLILTRPVKMDPFPQDFMEFSKNFAHISYVPKETYLRYQISDIIKEGRETRAHKLYARVKGTYIADAKRTTLLPSEHYRKTLQLASALEIPVKMQLTCTEGGNVLSGERQGQGCIIVGRDTVDFNRHLIQENIDILKEQGLLDKNFILNDDVLKTIFAVDFGMDPKNVIFIEQPGDYHLDMAIAFVGDNTVILNDAKLSEKKSRTVTRFLKLKTPFEKKVAKELASQGFIVLRHPCTEYQKKEGEIMMTKNFCNCIFGVSASTKQKFIIALGCSEQEQYEFRNLMRKAEIKDAQIFFLDRTGSLSCLEKLGGISCLTKLI